MNWANYGIDLKQVVGGKTYCPRCHNERKHKYDRSLSIDLETGLFNCHNAGCGFKGSAASKVKNFVVPTQRLQKVSDKILKWFEERGISNNTLLRFNITESVEWMPQHDREVPCINFNYFRNGQLVNIKFRGPQKAFKMIKDAELVFYNIDSIKDSKEVVCVEGELDCLSAHECGIYNCVSVPNGASLGSMKLEYLDNCWQDFEDKEKIILATDNDEAGRALREELARRLGKERCWTVDFGDCKDVNEVLVKHGKEKAKEIINNAVAWPLEGVITMDDMFETIEKYYQDGYPKGFDAGIPLFDEHLTFAPGQLTIVTGIPGCFGADQEVLTENGAKKISEISVGDRVVSYNLSTRQEELRMVVATPVHEQTSQRIFQITLSDGTEIIVTEDHEFFDGFNYVPIKTLLDEKTMERGAWIPHV